MRGFRKNEGKPTVFSRILYENQRVKPPEAQRQAGSGARSPRVIVVDDEVLPRRAVARWLGGLGLDVVAVATAAEALLLLSQEKFDVVVADWLLGPGERGDWLLAEVRTRYPEVRRVLFSGQPV